MGVLDPEHQTLVSPSWSTSKMSEKEAYDVEEYVQDAGPTLTFQNLTYCVQERKFFCKKGPAKYILKDVR